MLGKRHSEEAKEKMRLAKKDKMSGANNHFFGKKHSQETKEKMRAAKLENPTKYWLGKKRSPETVEKVRQSMLGKYVGRKHSTRTIKKIKQNIPSGEDHHMWKGDLASYSSLHHWVRRHLIKSDTCTKCLKKCKTHWANKSREYRRDLEDWLELCPKCHGEYDSGDGSGAIKRFNEKIKEQYAN